MNVEFVQRSKRIVSIDEFFHCIGPQKISKVDLLPPSSSQFFLRKVISVDGENFFIPSNMKWIKPIFELAKKNQELIGIKHSFCYVTIRHGLVNTVDDDEWHVDGFSTRITHIPEQNYVWSNTHGTEYNHLGSISFPDDFDPLKHSVHKFLQKFVKDENTEVLDDCTLFCMDPYMLHRRPTCTKGMMRTFVRISFVPIEINDISNTQNELLTRNYTRDGIKFRKELLEYGVQDGLY